MILEDLERKYRKVSKRHITDDTLLHKTLANQALRSTDVLILCGGKGTRLRTAVKDIPKSMARVNGRPFLDLLIDYARGYGARRFILCTGYKSGVIEKHYKNQSNCKIIFSPEKKPLGTAGALKNASKRIRSGTFLVMNGDSYCPVNLSDMLRFHSDKKALISIALCKAGRDGKDYGSVIMDKSFRITTFKEKKSKLASYLNAGIYLFSRKALKFIPSSMGSSLELDIFPRLTLNCLFGYPSKKHFIDIGTPKRYKQAQRTL